MSIKRTPSPRPSHRTTAPETAQVRHGVARVISKLGWCSRSRAHALVAEGRVSVDGRAVYDPEFPVDAQRSVIAIDGAKIAAAEKVYFAVNKPRGYVITANDERGRATIYDLLAERGMPLDRWIAPAGRLDKASEGLLLMSNDSAWAAALGDPASRLTKTYHVQINSTVDAELQDRMRVGVAVDGRLLAFRSVRELRRGEKNTWLEVVLDEGKNRQIRNVLAALDIGVLRLIRVAIGPLALGDLPKGGWRALRAEEVAALSAAAR